ncbi:MAG: OmpA family protein [Saprospiraceae bacterium]
MNSKFSPIALLFLATGWLNGQNAMFSGNNNTPISGYEVTNLEAINSDQLDYCAMPLGNKVIFTSTRNNDKLFHCDKDLAKGHYSDLWVAKKDGAGELMEPTMLEGEVNGKYHDGACTFTPDGTTMIFSRNNKKGVNAKGSIDLKLYQSKYKNGAWVDITELPYNSDDYCTCHPALNPTGNWLFFASNRPGGYGGMDIYVAEKKGENWGAPINLGPEVNSAGNELFPFVSAEGYLYFSSDGFPGLGGLDIFSIKIHGGSEPEGRTRLDVPINSSYDDFAFTSNPNGTAGYLTSNRPGGKGLDDLYSWKFTGLKPVIATICVVDKSTNERIGDADLTIEPIGENLSQNAAFNGPNGYTFLQMQATTVMGKEYLVLVPYQNSMTEASNKLGNSCNVKYAVLPGTKYRVTASKNGYQTSTKIVSAEEMTAQAEWLLAVEPNRGPIAINGKVKDKNNGSPIPLADVKVKNSCNNQEIAYTANNSGDFTFMMECGCDYEIVASKGEYHYDVETLSSTNIPCEKNDVTVLLYLEREFVPSLPKANYEVGKVIKLEDVYYDYNQFLIRSDAASELDKVVNLLKEYPSMEIELSSHTDARGSDSYNKWLSQKRAEKAVEYIISKGIARNRLRAAGYGETRLVNHCGNNVECDEYEHQQNRRTEIKVTKLDEKNVKVVE